MLYPIGERLQTYCTARKKWPLAGKTLYLSTTVHRISIWILDISIKRKIIGYDKSRKWYYISHKNVFTYIRGYKRGRRRLSPDKPLCARESWKDVLWTLSSNSLKNTRPSSTRSQRTFIWWPSRMAFSRICQLCCSRVCSFFFRRSLPM